MRTEKATILGPYVEQHGEKERFRLILKSSGGRKSLFYSTLAEARRAKAQRQKESLRLDENAVEELIEEYVQYIREDEGYRGGTQTRVQTRLRHFLGSEAMQVRLSTVTECKAEQMYRGQTQRLGRRADRVLSPTTHRGDLALVKRFCRWAQKAGHITKNPFAPVEPVGRDRAGKKQLRSGRSRTRRSPGG